MLFTDFKTKKATDEIVTTSLSLETQSHDQTSLKWTSALDDTSAILFRNISTQVGGDKRFYRNSRDRHGSKRQDKNHQFSIKADTWLP